MQAERYTPGEETKVAVCVYTSIYYVVFIRRDRCFFSLIVLKYGATQLSPFSNVVFVDTSTLPVSRTKLFTLM